ncbi:MAG TPA: GrpB family protein [Thermoanaerobaculia bacterium]|jgi:GrpB-like predicted nucleotidyltransferase (UPF0157 family)|nr:GrpB family protein [Thermoanaerobaculia bacterium]
MQAAADARLNRVLRTARRIKSLRTRIERYGVETVEETFRRWQAVRIPELPLAMREHDPAWAELFAEESRRVRSRLGPSVVSIQHFGSTSIPPLPSKDIVDFYVAIDALPDAPELVSAMADLGYELYGNSPVDPETVWYWSTQGNRAFAAHVCRPGRAWLSTVVNFRDFMRVHPQERRRYEEGKRQLAAEADQDFLGYSVGKMALFAELNDRADAWHAAGRPAAVTSE